MKALVTGGTGFIGKNLVEKLIEEGHEVVATSSGSGNDLPKKVKVKYHSLFGIDLKDFQPDVVFHLAANNDTLCQDEEEMLRTNLHDPSVLFQNLANKGCKKFVYASSTAVYGNEASPYIEGQTPEKPLNIYGKSKKMFDDWAMEFARDKTLQVVGFRYCNVYGPGEGHKGRRMSMIGQMLRKVMQEKPI